MKNARYQKAREANLIRAEIAARSAFACQFDLEDLRESRPVVRAGLLTSFVNWILSFRLIRNALQAV